MFKDKTVKSQKEPNQVFAAPFMAAL